MSMTRNEWERKLSEMAALRRIVIAINSHIDDLDRVVGLILASACDLISAQHGSLMLLNPEAETLHIAAVVGHDWTPEKKGCILKLGEGITGRVAATRIPYLCRDCRSDTHYFPLFENVNSELAVPVVSQGRVIGVINVDSERLDAFHQADLDLLSMLADHAAIAVENARQYAYAQAAREKWRSAIDALPVGIMIGNDELCVECANTSLLHYFQMTSDEVVGHSLQEVLSQARLSVLEEAWEIALKDQGHFEKKFFDANRKTHLKLQARRFESNNRPAYLFVFSKLEG